MPVPIRSALVVGASLSLLSFSPPPREVPPRATGRATLTITLNPVPATGMFTGTAVFTDVGTDVQIAVAGKGLVGNHGTIIHKGTCASLGDHLDYHNPPKEHGRDNKKGFHTGDLLNLLFDDQPTDDLTQSLTANDLTIAQLTRPDSPTALVIHEYEDTQLANAQLGNAVACGDIH